MCPHRDLPSTKVTGISSANRSLRAGSSRIEHLVVGLAQVGADPLDHRAGVVAEVAARLAVERDPRRSLEEALTPPPAPAAEPALLDLAGHASGSLVDDLDPARLLEPGQPVSQWARTAATVGRVPAGRLT